MIKNRGELIDVTDVVNLTVQFKDNLGNPVNIDNNIFPNISIVQPSGNVLFPPTSVGVTQIAVGKYSFLYTIPINGPYGVYNDIWSGYVNGNLIQTMFDFIVLYTNIPQINHDGYVSLGDDPGFDYSQTAIKNINKLIKMLKGRLNSSGKSKSTDQYGNVIYVDCDIFSIENLTTFLATALSDFNQVPFFTSFRFDEDEFINQFGEILVEGATLYSLASKALIERGREFTIADNSISFNPPTVKC